MNFKNYLTVEEREACTKAGIVRKLAEYGVSLSDVGIEKTATIGDVLRVARDSANDLAKGTVGLSFLAGIPAGLLLHVVDRSLTKDDKESERLEKMRDTYLDFIAKVKNRARDAKKLKLGY